MRPAKIKSAKVTMTYGLANLTNLRESEALLDYLFTYESCL